MKKIFLVICFVVALIGCTDIHEVKQGYVVAQKCVPQHSQSYYNVCLKIPMVRVVPEQYFVWLADSINVSKIQVTRSMFYDLKLGCYYNLKN